MGVGVKPPLLPVDDLRKNRPHDGQGGARLLAPGGPVSEITLHDASVHQQNAPDGSSYSHLSDAGDWNRNRPWEAKGFARMGRVFFWMNRASSEVIGGGVLKPSQLPFQANRKGKRTITPKRDSRALRPHLPELPSSQNIPPLTEITCPVM